MSVEQVGGAEVCGLMLKALVVPGDACSEMEVGIESLKKKCDGRVCGMRSAVSSD